MTVDDRVIIQGATLTLSIFNLALLTAMVKRRRLAWRYTVLPGIILVELSAFYFYVIFLQHTYPPSQTAVLNFVSAVIRFQTVAALTVILISLWHPRK